MAVNTNEHLLQFFLFILLASHATSESKLECKRNCGPVDIPYPFGTRKGCYLDDSFSINCTRSNSSTPDTPFLGDGTEVRNISLDGEVHVSVQVFRRCPRDDGANVAFIPLGGLPNFSIPPSRNRFVTIGCDIVGQFMAYDPLKVDLRTPGVCESSCNPGSKLTSGPCDGTATGCCQIGLPRGQSHFIVAANFLSELFNENSSATLLGYFRDSGHSFIRNKYPCGAAFIAENSYNFNATLLKTLEDKTTAVKVPLVLDWVVGYQTCEKAQLNLTSYACRAENSECKNSTTGVGYRCKCRSGFGGNPYIARGCTPLPPRAMEKSNDRKVIDDGNYKSLHPRNKSSRDVHILIIAFGMSSSVFALLVGTLYFCFILPERKLIKIRKKYFQQNGGILLQQQIAKHKESTERTTIFTEQELKKATDNYDEARVIGKGGHGTVYKGVLSNGRAIAIKKSKISNQSEIKQFINEIVVLSQINHRNVVKLLGCCLETEVPLLVYEFITNGTLSDHIHVEDQACHLPWSTRLRVATETAEALAYLHSAAWTPVIHRDVKTVNILLDQNLTAKVSDFGASKLVPLDQSQLTTLVQGTLGYLDPEYFQTSQLTEKSDVYSFGVVLAELLTSKMALSFARLENERNLSMLFASSIREGRLLQILDKDIVNDANVEQIMEVANLAKKCLMLKGEERPTMKEVAMELEGLRIMEKLSLGTTSVSREETDQYLLNVPMHGNIVHSEDGSSESSRFHSMQIQILESLGGGR